VSLKVCSPPRPASFEAGVVV